MTDKELILDTLRHMGKLMAEDVQACADDLTGTQLNAKKDYVPDFKAACARANMLDRSVGFVCKSSAGRVVRLLQNYDSAVYTQEPEELSAQWGFVWSTDPVKALPFLSLATSPYNEGDCCTENGVVWRSVEDNNVWAPSAYPQGWVMVEL